MTGKHEIEIWGDGMQTRSFMYISDCLKGIYMITESDTWIPYRRPSLTAWSISAGHW